MIQDKLFFVDTNILITACDTSRTNHQKCLQLLELGYEGKIHLLTSGQVIREYLVVATRPKSNNGLGLNIQQSLENTNSFRKIFKILEESSHSCSILLDLMKEYSVSGKRIHDANIVATMNLHNIKCLITDNIDDFKSFDQLELLNSNQMIELLQM